MAVLVNCGAIPPFCKLLDCMDTQVKVVDMLAPALCGEWCACFAIETWGLVVMTH